MDFNENFAALGIAAPQATPPLANYLPYLRSGKLLFLAGQLPVRDGKLICTGRLGESVSMEEGYQAARLCAVNLVLNLRAALDGDLNAVVRCVRLGGFVASSNDFFDQPQVINGASDLMVEIFGDAGRHARAAVGVNALPRNAAVEVEAVFELK